MNETAINLKELGWDEKLIECFINSSFQPIGSTNTIDITTPQFYETHNIMIKSEDNSIVFNADT